ncbi:MAG TPA: nuclear transport factor 2 family protein [Acetobacteraceae bacterium]|nr:nuclear transport factor 2 family protein [Acetobacteraceae bacterium]
MLRLRAFPLLLLLGASPVAAAAATPPALVAVVRDFVQRVSGTDANAFASLFTGAPSITDTLHPYHWQGKDAAAHYFADLRADLHAVGWEGLRLASHGDPFVVSGSDVAYAAVPLLVEYAAKGESHQDEGIFTLSLQHEKSGWKITSATWTYTKPPS